MRPLPYSALKEIEHFVKNQTETFAFIGAQRDRTRTKWLASHLLTNRVILGAASNAAPTIFIVDRLRSQNRERLLR